eukprot:EG_transcript_5613
MVRRGGFTDSVSEEFLDSVDEKEIKEYCDQFKLLGIEFSDTQTEEQRKREAEILASQREFWRLRCEAAIGHSHGPDSCSPCQSCKASGVSPTSSLPGEPEIKPESVDPCPNVLHIRGVRCESESGQLSVKSDSVETSEVTKPETFYDPWDEWWQKVEAGITELFSNTFSLNERLTKLEEVPSQSESSHLEGRMAEIETRLRNLADGFHDLFTRTCSEIENRFSERIQSLCEKGEALSKRLESEEKILEERLKMFELQIAEKLQPSEKFPSPENFVSVNLNSGHVTNLQPSSVSSEKSSSDFATQPRKFRQTKKFWRPAKNSWNDFQFLRPSWFHDWWGWDWHLNPWNSWGWFPPHQWWW